MTEAITPEWSGPGEEGGAGTRFHEIATRSFIFARIEMEPGAQLKSHVHPEEQLFYVLEGNLKYSVGGSTHDIGPGELIFVPANTEHGGVADPKTGAVFLEAKESIAR